MAEYAIIAIGYNRPDSMKRLLYFLEHADYDNDNVMLIISIDNSGNDDVEKVAEDAQWSHGEKIIKTYPERQGLRNHILHCGNFVKDYRAVAVFEDDVVPSAGFYQYMKQTVPFYENDESIAGISLYTHLWNVNVNMPFQPAYGNSDVFFMQFAQSWGQIWMKDSWAKFAEWYSKNSDEIEPCDSLPRFVTGWPKSSWLKYHIKYCVDNNKYFVYPYKSLSTCFSDVGEHCQEKDTHLQVPMLSSVKSDYHFSRIKDPNAVIYDAFFERKLNSGNLSGNIEIDDVCFDLYGGRNSYGNKKYVVTTEALPYKCVNSFGMELRPHEENVISNVKGQEIFLYQIPDRTEIEGAQRVVDKKVAKQKQIDCFRYAFRIYKKTPMLCRLVADKVKKKFMGGVTVAIPNYNNGQYIRQCIESIEEQTYEVEEIIVVDDCSTDNSIEILRTLCDEFCNIRVIALEKNAGVSHARNTAILACKTDYITFIDPDDFYCNNRKLEFEMKVINDHLPKDVLAFSYIKEASVDGVIVSKNAQNLSNYIEGNVFFDYMKGRGRIGLARDYCIRTEILKEVGMYQENMNLYEDLDLLIRIAEKYEFYCTKDYGTAHRMVPNGLSRRPASEHDKAKWEIRNTYLKDAGFLQKMYLKVYWSILKMARKSVGKYKN